MAAAFQSPRIFVESPLDLWKRPVAAALPHGDVVENIETCIFFSFRFLEKIIDIIIIIYYLYCNYEFWHILAEAKG